MNTSLAISRNYQDFTTTNKVARRATKVARMLFVWRVVKDLPYGKVDEHCEQLAKRLGVSKSTVWRDVQIMQQAEELVRQMGEVT